MVANSLGPPVVVELVIDVVGDLGAHPLRVIVAEESNGGLMKIRSPGSEARTDEISIVVITTVKETNKETRILVL